MGEEWNGGLRAKKFMFLCRCLTIWEEIYPYLTKSFVDQNHAFCKLCCIDFSIGHDEKSDVTQHDTSAKHKGAQESQKHTASLTPFMSRKICEKD